jgi:hypothetical protein
LQHSLFWKFAAGSCAAAPLARGAGVVATLVGSDLAEPPQHEPDMIDLQYFELLISVIIDMDMYCDKSRLCHR